ncbi:M-phase phosphoprotein 9 [Biomphalaria pfeifferi]|uniref:M-phase phosphoprotein 9 n=1 Tax=Biomphalaria pfeifferi TaxID=112525 RepID=A0AAD8F170_BIOPF|nr:M-phase phosphoprotein 9 [Biomphalaria pfeifferi]
MQSEMDSQNVQVYHIANEDQETCLPEEGNHLTNSDSKDLGEKEAKVQENVKDDSDPGESDTIVAVEIVHAILDEQEITFPSKDVNHNPMIEIKEADSKDTAVNGMEGSVTLVTTETFLAPVEDNEAEHIKESSEVSVMLSREEPEKSCSGQHETPDTNLGTAPVSSDTELDAFFGTGDSKENEGRGHFPALDFVDLETDEEGHQDLNRDDGGGGEEESSVHRETTCETPQGLKDAADSGVAEGDVKMEDRVTNPTDDAVTNPTDDACQNAQTASGNSPPRLDTKDYPLNYQNYKVCRELQPGVEECIILETGEQVICDTRPKAEVSEQTVDRSLNSTSDSNASSSHSQIFVRTVGNVPYHNDTIFKDSDPNRRVYDIDDNTSPRSTPEVTLKELAFNGEDNSFKSPDGLSFHTLRSDSPESPQEMVPGSDQEVYITENGVAVIMDNVEDDIKMNLQSSTAWVVSIEEGFSVMRESRLVQRNCESHPLSGDLRDRFVHLDLNNEEQKLNSEIKLERISQIPLDDIEDKSENFAPLMEPQLLGNKNNNNQEMRLEEVDVSNNADDKLSDEENFRHPRSSDLRYTFSSSSRAQPASHAYSHYENRSYQHSYDPSESADSSSVDSTSLSTRYTPIEQGDPKRDSARSESMTVPKFKTLQDQQVSWLEMFKMIEEQHKCDLQAQYMEHQRILQEMQRNMEKELIKQQETLKKRLSSHREILEELSPSRGSGRKMDEDHNINQSRKFDEDDFKESRRMNESSSHTTLMGVPVSLRNPPPLNRYIQHEFLEKKKEMSSPSRQADTSLNLSRLSTVGGDKQLRGGVYSSPLPLAKVKHKNSPRGSKSYEDTHNVSTRDDMSRNSVHWVYDVATSQRPGSGDSSLCESDDVLSPRTRISLKEKHAKHLADLKAYYEEELQELRQLLAARVDRLGADGGRSGMTAGDKILSSENQELRQKCKELQDMLHDSRIENRELQQKIQGLEIRASDYAGRFDTAQAQVLSLKTRLEEVTDFAKEKEALAAEVELKHKKTIEALQMSFKKEKELSESLHNAKITIQRLVDKYETLEKDYALIKESLAATEEKLFTSRSEAMDFSSKLTRLEHEVKQLKHDNEVLKHEHAIACSNQMLKTSYEEAYSPSTSGFDRSRPVYSSPAKARTRSADGSQFSNTSPESEADLDYIRSPILRAERELRNLQKSFSTQDFTPKLQKKFYGSEMTPRKSGVLSSSKSLSNGHLPAQDPHTKLSSPHSRLSKLGDETPPRTPLKGGYTPSKDVSKGGARVQRESRVRSSPSSKKLCYENGLSSEQALEKVKSGEIVSRPAWEDVYTSMAAPARQDSIAGKLAALNSSREIMIKERIQNIHNLERKYDELSQEKKKYESALNRLPAQGHRGEKDKLEAELDRVDKELGSVRMSLKRYHVLKSTI